MSHPNNNKNWEWKFCGYDAPSPASYDEHNGMFSEFSSCFGYFCGIGEFSYWISSELNKLSIDDSVRLLSILEKHKNLKDEQYNGLYKKGLPK